MKLQGFRHSFETNKPLSSVQGYISLVSLVQEPKRSLLRRTKSDTSEVTSRDISQGQAI